MMTPAQVELARHALGLPNKRRQSYRNYFVCGVGHRDHGNWLAMAAASYARALTGTQPGFALTEAGANAALKPGERLDPEDFPLKDASK
jgi:hypothetical protein